jgi:hypothetical protein
LDLRLGDFTFLDFLFVDLFLDLRLDLPPAWGEGPAWTFPRPEQCPFTHRSQISFLPLKLTWYIFPLRPFFLVPKGKDLGDWEGIPSDRFLDLDFLAPPNKFEIKFSIIVFIL